MRGCDICRYPELCQTCPDPDDLAYFARKADMEATPEPTEPGPDDYC